MTDWLYPNLFDDPETGCVADALQARWPLQFHPGNRWLAIETAGVAICALRDYDAECAEFGDVEVVDVSTEAV